MVMNTLYTLLGAGIALLLGLSLLRQYFDKARASKIATQHLFSEVEPLLSGFELKPGDTAGSWKASGHYDGELFQYHVVVDTLSTRKLPSLWLLLSLPKAQPLQATIDLMMRPAGHTTFSQFDFLGHTIRTPADCPEAAVVRSDTASPWLPVQAMALAYPILQNHGGKELLLSPRGLRIVVQVSEADKLRYGVFREARFEDAVIDGQQARNIMNTLLAMDTTLKEPS